MEDRFWHIRPDYFGLLAARLPVKRAQAPLLRAKCRRLFIHIPHRWITVDSQVVFLQQAAPQQCESCFPPAIGELSFGGSKTLFHGREFGKPGEPLGVPRHAIDERQQLKALFPKGVHQR
jgi:hypothetical protein